MHKSVNMKIIVILFGYAFLIRFVHNADLKSAKFEFFYGQEQVDREKFEIDNVAEILNHTRYDKAKKTTIYAHGYAEKETDESLHIIVSAYLERTDHNLIVLNWTELSRGNYLFRAVPNLYELGPYVATGLLKLLESGLDTNDLHLVGHSLGGQLVGSIGRNVIEQSNHTVILRRITALDPAFPAFYPGIFFQPLSANDAKFVDVIHTDSGIYGAPVSTGTVDFWPNGGTTLQPGCPPRDYRLLSNRDLCSHRRSWAFWAESVINKQQDKFNAISASSWFFFRLGITGNYIPGVVMGIDCPENLQGDYYLLTNSQEPYAKGIPGTTYRKL